MGSKIISTLILIFFMLLYGQGYHPAMAETPGGPELFVPETTAEFQTVHEGATVQHSFVVHNRGSSPLDILEVRTD